MPSKKKKEKPYYNVVLRGSNSRGGQEDIAEGYLGHEWPAVMYQYDVYVRTDVVSKRRTVYLRTILTRIEDGDQRFKPCRKDRNVSAAPCY